MVRKGPVAVIFVVCLSLAAGVVYWAAMGQAQQAVKPGESVHVFDDPSYAAEHGAVEFSHLAHQTAFGQEKLDCKPCHMPPNAPLFSMKKRAAGEKREIMKMEDMVKGKTCGHCHDGKTEVGDKTVFGVEAKEDCGRCHQKKV